MAKRFTDTEKFIDPWFRRLSSKHKLLWDWLLCNCDHAGIITVDFEFIEMVLNEKFEEDVIEKYFSERTVQIGLCKYFIPKFLRFQYGKLNPSSKVHASVIARLKEEGILYSENDSIKDIENNARVIGYPKGMDTTKEKDKDKEKEKIKGNNISELVNINFKSAQEKSIHEIASRITGNATVDGVIELYNEELAGTGKLKKCPGLGSKAIKELLNTFSHIPTLDQWSDLFSLVKANAALTGASKTVFLATLDWLAIEDNALKVLAGKYDLPTDAEAREKSNEDYIKSIKLEGA